MREVVNIPVERFERDPGDAAGPDELQRLTEAEGTG